MTHLLAEHLADLLIAFGLGCLAPPALVLAILWHDRRAAERRHTTTDPETR